MLTNKNSYGIIFNVFSNANAGMAELADAPDLESGVSRREGSSPFTRTNDVSVRTNRTELIQNQSGNKVWLIFFV